MFTLRLYHHNSVRQSVSYRYLEADCGRPARVSRRRSERRLIMRTVVTTSPRSSCEIRHWVLLRTSVPDFYMVNPRGSRHPRTTRGIDNLTLLGRLFFIKTSLQKHAVASRWVESTRLRILTPIVSVPGRRAEQSVRNGERMNAIGQGDVSNMNNIWR